MIFQLETLIVNETYVYETFHAFKRVLRLFALFARNRLKMN